LNRGSLLASLRRCAVLAEPLNWWGYSIVAERPAVSGKFARDGDRDD
jgi:hypothetical protein